MNVYVRGIILIVILVEDLDDLREAFSFISKWLFFNALLSLEIVGVCMLYKPKSISVI